MCLIEKMNIIVKIFPVLHTFTSFTKFYNNTIFYKIGIKTLDVVINVFFLFISLNLKKIPDISDWPRNRLISAGLDPGTKLFCL